MMMTICIDQTRRGLVTYLPCYGELGIVRLLLLFFTLGSKGSRGLKTKVQNVPGMAIGPGNR